MNPSFEAFAFSSVTNARFGNTCVHVVTGHHFFHFNEGTYFVYVWKGLAWHNSDIPLRAGMYGCFNSGHIQTDHGSKVLVIQCMEYNGMRSMGGPIEKTGRLKYIDGCTDSLLIPPVKKGDPCLNHLHFPVGIEQTMHTHPSIRIGQSLGYLNKI